MLTGGNTRNLILKVKALVISVIAIIVVVFLVYGWGYWHPFYVKAVGARTVNDVVELYGDKARSTLPIQLKN